jgi:hypothetical protein
MPADKSRKPPTTLLLLGVLSAISWALAAWYFATGHGNLDATGHAVGRDFVNLWTAGQLIADGRVIDVFDPAKFGAAQRALLSPDFPFHFWSYPPTFLFAAVPFGHTSYLGGLVIWSLAGAIALLFAGRALLGDWVAPLLLVASPAVAVNLVLGQNGAVTAALLMTACAWMARRPASSGALLGVLTFKPQLGLLVPFALLAERRWTTITTAIVAALAFAGLSAAVFGLEAWRAFVGDALPMQTAMMSGGTGPFRRMMTSAFMAGRLLGLALSWAMLAQVPFTLAGALFVWRAWRSDASLGMKFAILAVAGHMATPQAFNYDMIPLAAAALLLLRGDRFGCDRITALVLWVLPVAAMPINTWGVPATPLDLLAVCLYLDWAYVFRRARAPIR